jgi:hypothetical protein
LDWLEQKSLKDLLEQRGTLDKEWALALLLQRHQYDSSDLNRTIQADSKRNDFWVGVFFGAFGACLLLWGWHTEQVILVLILCLIILAVVAERMHEKRAKAAKERHKDQLEQLREAQKADLRSLAVGDPEDRRDA